MAITRLFSTSYICGVRGHSVAWHRVPLRLEHHYHHLDEGESEQDCNPERAFIVRDEELMQPHGDDFPLPWAVWERFVEYLTLYHRPLTSDIDAETEGRERRRLVAV